MLMGRQTLFGLLPHDQYRIRVSVNTASELLKNLHVAKYNKYQANYIKKQCVRRDNFAL